MLTRFSERNELAEFSDFTFHVSLHSLFMQDCEATILFPVSGQLTPFILTNFPSVFYRSELSQCLKIRDPSF